MGRIAGLLLALIDLPDFSTPLANIAGSVERIADSETAPADASREGTASAAPEPISDRAKPVPANPAAPAKEVGSHV